MTVGKLIDSLFDERQAWESLWDITYRYIAPERATVFRKNNKLSPNEIQSEVFDSTAIESAERLVNLLIAGLIPPWGRWFRLQPRPSLDEAIQEELRDPLQKIAERMLQTLQDSNFYQEAQPALLDDAVGGTGALAIREFGERLQFRCIPLSELAIQEDSLGRVTHIARKGEIDLGSLRRLYWDKIPTVRKDQLEKRQDHEREQTYEVSVLGADEQYTYERILKGDPEVVLEKQITKFPRLIAFRWSKVPGHAYGRGPGLRALSDVRALNKLKEMTLKNAALAVSGVFTVVNDGVLNPHTMKIQPGALIPVATNSPNEPSVLPLPSFADFDVSNFSMDELRNSIKSAFMADQFQPLGRTPMSATEVAERTRVIASDMGASLARLQNELLMPVLRYTLDWMRRQGRLPDGLGLDDEFTEVQFVSRLAQAQWTEDRASVAELTQFAGMIGEVDPRASLTVDGEAAVRHFATLQGTPQKLIRSPEQVTQMMEQAQQAVQQGAAPGPEGMQ